MRAGASQQGPGAVGVPPASATYLKRTWDWLKRSKAAIRGKPAKFRIRRQKLHGSYYVERYVVKLGTKGVAAE